MKKFLSLLIMLPLFVVANDNNKVDVETTGSQSNDNLVFNVTQIGFNNDTIFSLGGASNQILIKQTGNKNFISFVPTWGTQQGSGGDLNGDSNSLHFEQNCTRGSSCAESNIDFHIKGDSNSVRWGQGLHLSGSSDTTFTSDGDEGGGVTLTLDIHGSNNALAGYQRNGNNNAYSAHDATVYLYADDNSFYVVQETDGKKTLSLKSYVDGNTGTISQSGSGAHNANITLTGTYSTNLNLTQQSNSVQNYTLTQNCVTAGGCSVSVTQGN